MGARYIPAAREKQAAKEIRSGTDQTEKEKARARLRTWKKVGHVIYCANKHPVNNFAEYHGCSKHLYAPVCARW
jgi:hypothetical protein